MAILELLLIALSGVLTACTVGWFFVRLFWGRITLEDMRNWPWP